MKLYQCGSHHLCCHLQPLPGQSCSLERARCFLVLPHKLTLLCSAVWLQAKFRFTMVAPEGQTVLFNMPEAKAEPRAGGLVAHTFQETPIMSTYLVAFIVGRLQAVSKTVPASAGTAGTARTVQVWGTPQR